MNKPPVYKPTQKSQPPMRTREPQVIIALPVVDDDNLMKFYKQIVENDINGVKKELNKDPSIMNIPNKIDTKIEYPLHTIIQSSVFDKTTMIEFLIKNSANVNCRNEKNETPLHMACVLGDNDIIKLLIKNNADVNIKDSNGKSPLEHVINIINYVDCDKIKNQESLPLIKPHFKSISGNSIIQLNKTIVDTIEKDKNITDMTNEMKEFINISNVIFKDEFDKFDENILDTFFKKISNESTSDVEKENLQNVAFEFKKIITSKLDVLYNVKSINKNNLNDGETKLISGWKKENENKIEDVNKLFVQILDKLQNEKNTIKNSLTESKNEIGDIILLNDASAINNNENKDTPYLDDNEFSPIKLIKDKDIIYDSTINEYTMPIKEMKSKKNETIKINPDIKYNESIKNSNRFYRVDMTKIKKETPSFLTDDKSKPNPQNLPEHFLYIKTGETDIVKKDQQSTTTNIQIETRMTILSVPLHYIDRINENLNDIKKNYNFNPSSTDYKTYQETIPMIILYTLNIVINILICKTYLEDTIPAKLLELKKIIMDKYSKYSDRSHSFYLKNMAFFVDKIISNSKDQLKKLEELYKQCQTIFDILNKFISASNEMYSLNYIESINNKTTYTGPNKTFENLTKLQDLYQMRKKILKNGQDIDISYLYSEYFPQIYNKNKLIFLDTSTEQEPQNGIIVPNTVLIPDNIKLKDDKTLSTDESFSTKKQGKIGVSKFDPTKKYAIIGQNIVRYFEILKIKIINEIKKIILASKPQYTEITKILDAENKDDIYTNIIENSTDNVLNFLIKRYYNKYVSKFLNEKINKSVPSVNIYIPISDSAQYTDYGFTLDLKKLINDIIEKIGNDRLHLLNIGNLDEDIEKENILRQKNNSPSLEKTDDICYKSNIENIHTLVENKADVNFVDNTGKSFIHYAIDQVNSDLLSLIVQNKPNSKKIKFFNKTPKEIAINNYLEYLNKFSLENATTKFNKKVISEILGKDIFQKNVLKFTKIILPFTLVLINGLFYENLNNDKKIEEMKIDYIPLLFNSNKKEVDFNKSYFKPYDETIDKLNVESKSLEYKDFLNKKLFQKNIPVIDFLSEFGGKVAGDDIKIYDDIFNKISSGTNDFQQMNLRFYAELWKQYLSDKNRIKNNSNFHLIFVELQQKKIFENNSEIEKMIKISESLNKMSENYFALPFSVNNTQQKIVQYIAHVLKHTIFSDFYYTIAKAFYSYTTTVKSNKSFDSINLELEKIMNNPMFTEFFFKKMPEEIVRVHYKLFDNDNNQDPLESLSLSDIFKNITNIISVEQNSFTDKLRDVLIPFFLEYTVVILDNLKSCIDTYFRNLQYEYENLKIIKALSD